MNSEATAANIESRSDNPTWYQPWIVIEKIETPRPNGKTVRFQTVAEQPYADQESITDDANGKIAKTVDSEENYSNQPNTNRYKFIIGTIITKS